MAQTGYNAPQLRNATNVAGWFLRSQNVGVGALIAVVVLPDYLIYWEPIRTNYLVGEVFPAQWTIVRMDGGLLLPSTATLTMVEQGNRITTISAGQIYSSSAVPATSVTVGAIVTASNAGTTRLTLSVGLNSAPAQTREITTLLMFS